MPNTKSYYKILCLILFSFILFPPKASAAEGFNIIIPAASSITDKDITVQLPANVMAAADSALPRSLLFKSPDSLEAYLDWSFKRQAAAAANKNFFTLSDFLKTHVLPNLKYEQSKNAVWREDNGRVTEFQADAWGRSYDVWQILKTLRQSRGKNPGDITIEAIALPPQVKLAEVNGYGITGLVAKGQSNFAGSSANRVKNIRVGTSRYQGVIIPAGANFSFNDLLGPVDGEHGFAPELVIKHNGLVPEFGGGICQVSTTVFRTALNGGLPITERRNHSFAVQYYAPQGTDATIYPGVQDLKFTNDTGSALLIWSDIAGTILTFNFYGNPDGRRVAVDDPVRYDIRTTGAFRARLKRTVAYANGTSKEDIFYSSYRPKEEFTQTTTAQEPTATVPQPTAPAAPAPDPNAGNQAESESNPPANS